MKTLLRACVVLACALLLAGCQQELYMDLTETSANEMIEALANAGIGASKAEVPDHGWELRVDGSSVPAALNALKAVGLPRQPTENLGELFSKQGLVSTPAEERIRYIYGAEQELERTLLDVNGVIVAHVHVVIPENDPLSDKIKPSSASVYIKYRPGIDLKMMAPMVKDLVAHSIEGLSYDNVSLFLQAAPPKEGERAEDAQGGPLARALSLIALVLVLSTIVAVAVFFLRRGQFKLMGRGASGANAGSMSQEQTHVG
ncbi:type III secretion system inner membrane ring lipoprotein SctJ [Trinickia acidisoli]|uniref:type III secretion system inner membrane ring lipoprotein SctJ n=1 Tax=Trinickia acidisoli TaxID=2767482 RepID=UPI001A8DA8FB|nr:type III secretion inner membrane ring lipoprotein SctJ [Trinickia acidisoli]